MQFSCIATTEARVLLTQPPSASMWRRITCAPSLRVSLLSKCSLYLLMRSWLAECNGFLLWSVSVAVYSQVHPSTRMLVDLVTLFTCGTVVLRSRVSQSSLDTQESQVKFTSSSQVPILIILLMQGQGLLHVSLHATVGQRTVSRVWFKICPWGLQQEAVRGQIVGAHA